MLEWAAETDELVVDRLEWDPWVGHFHLVDISGLLRVGKSVLAFS